MEFPPFVIKLLVNVSSVALGQELRCSLPELPQGSGYQALCIILWDSPHPPCALGPSLFALAEPSGSSQKGRRREVDG